MFLRMSLCRNSVGDSEYKEIMQNPFWVSGAVGLTCGW